MASNLLAMASNLLAMAIIWKDMSGLPKNRHKTRLDYRLLPTRPDPMMLPHDAMREFQGQLPHLGARKR